MIVDISAPNTVQAILEDGPEGIPTTSRRQTVSPLEEKIKLPYCGGYEHFERVGWLDYSNSARQLVFRWTTRTEVAE